MTNRLTGAHVVAALAVAFLGQPAHASAPAELLARFSAEAAAPAVPARGERLFTARHGRDSSCASCHGASPVHPGRHASTGKTISPLAPAVNPQRFTDAAKVEKWFRRNCSDVMGRDCSAAEKADILSWLMTLKP